MFKFKNAIKQKQFNIFPNIFSCCEVQLFQLYMECYPIYMPTAVGVTIPQSVGPIFLQFFMYMWLYLNNNIKIVSVLLV